jgi:hypothetical protein
MAAFDFPSSPSVNQTYTANGVTWKWNGTMWMRITGAGYLEKIEEGNSKVEVDDSGSGNVTITTDGSERLRVTSAGNLGIGGLTNPGALLSIPAGESNTPRLAIESAVDDNDFTITQYEDGNGTYTMLGQNVKLNTSGNNTILDSGHRTAGILLDARNNGAITFLTGGTNSVAEPVRIESNGRVAIGGFSGATHDLHIKTASSPAIKLEDTTQTTILQLYAQDSNANIGTHSQHDLRFNTDSTERLRIDSSGRLLLGLTSSIGGNAIFQVQGSGNKKAQFHQPDSGNSHIQFTNTQTGTSSNNGVEIGLGGDEQAQIWNYYNSFFRIGTNGTERLRITSGGDVLIADTTNTIYDDSTGGGMNLKANGQLVLKKQATSTADPLMWLNDTGQTTNKFILFAQDGTEKASIGLAGNDLRFARDGYNETLRITSDGDLKTGNINISGYPNTHNVDNYSVFLSDNHANTFFGQNLLLDYNGANNSGNHQLRVINQHAQIGGAGMLIGGNQSPNRNELNFYTVAANQPAGTRVDDTNKRLTIRSNGDITIRGTNSQYVEAAAFEITQASATAITTNNSGYVSFNSLRNTNSTIISHSSSTNPTRITFPVAGAVHFSMYNDIKVSGTTGYTQCRLLKNGTNDRYALITYTNNQWDTIMMNTVVEVAANDYLEVYYTGGDITGLDHYNWCSYNFVFYPINTNRG